MVISAPMEDSPAVSVTGSSSASVIWKPIDSGTPAWTRIPAQSTNSGGALPPGVGDVPGSAGWEGEAEGLGLGVVSSGRVSAAAGRARPSHQQHRHGGCCQGAAEAQEGAAG